MRHTHHSGLDHIHRRSNADSKESSSETRCYMAGDSVREDASSYEGLLDLQQSTLRTDVAAGAFGIIGCRNALHSSSHATQPGETSYSLQHKPSAERFFFSSKATMQSFGLTESSHSLLAFTPHAQKYKFGHHREVIG